MMAVYQLNGFKVGRSRSLGNLRHLPGFNGTKSMSDILVSKLVIYNINRGSVLRASNASIYMLYINQWSIHLVTGTWKLIMCDL